MKKKITYQSKYFSKQNHPKQSQIYVILGFLSFILVVIIVVLFALFGNKDSEALSFKKYDEVSIKNEIRLYLKLKEYNSLNERIDDYLSYKMDKNFKKQLIDLKISILMINNDYNQMIDLINKYKKYLKTEEKYFLYGYVYFLRKDFELSKNCLRKIKKNSEFFRDTALILAKIFIDEKESNKSIDILEKVDNKDNVILYNLAYLYLSKGELNSAANYINQIKKFDTENQLILFKSDLLKTNIFMANEDYKLAKDSIVRLENYPFLKDTYLYNYLIILHKTKEDKPSENLELYKNNIKELNSKKEFYPPLIYKLMFTILYFEGFYNIAITFFEENKDLILKDDFEKYILLAVDLYYKIGKYNKVIEIINYETMNSLSSKYFVLIYNIYYNAICKLNQYEQFVKTGENLLKTRSEKIEILNLLIECFIKQKKIEEAISFLYKENIFKSYPPYYYIWLAKLYIERNDIQNAYKNLKVVEKLDLSGYYRDEIYLFICKFYLKIKKLDDFKNLFSLISEDERKKIDNQILYLEYCISIDDYDSIVNIAENIVKEYNYDNRILFYIAKSYYRKKDYQKAIFYFSNLLEKTKNLEEKAIVAIYLGNCNAYIGNYSTALFYYKQAELWNKNQTYSFVNSQIVEKIRR